MRFLTAGESHGRALIGIIEGVPAHLHLSEDDFKKDLARRKLGFGRGTRQKIEQDHVQILSGVRHGKTIGSPIALMIENQDFKNWEKIMSVKEEDKTSDREVLVPRPGHADFVGALKYDFDDMRNILERSSARETTMRVALGCVAKKFLSELGISILSRVIQIGSIKDEAQWPVFSNDLQEVIDATDLRAISQEANQKMKVEIEQAQKEGDTLGGIFEVCVFGLPIGLGSYTQWNHRIEGKLAQAFMSLNAIKGIEIGEGFLSAQKRGSLVHDEIILNHGMIDHASNRSGGITGGMTTGQNLVLRAAMKPLSTLKKPLRSVELSRVKETEAHFERSDICAVPAAGVIGESLAALVLTQEVLAKFGGDSLQEIILRVRAWREQTSQKLKGYESQ